MGIMKGSADYNSYSAANYERWKDPVEALLVRATRHEETGEGG